MSKLKILQDTLNLMYAYDNNTNLLGVKFLFDGILYKSKPESVLLVR